MSEQLSPTVKNAQKVVTENKQTVSIRKVTIEAIAPVIQKLATFYIGYSNTSLICWSKPQI